jgi:HAMP domain-containing protein
LISKSRLLADSLAPILVNALVVGDLATAEQTLRGVNASGFFRVLALDDPHTARPMLDISSTDTASSSAPAWFVAMPDVRLAVPIEAGGAQYALLRLEPDASVVRQMLWDDARNALATTGLTLVLVLIAVILDRGFRPIRELGLAAQRFGEGELSARMPDTELPEVCPTVHAFNSMADKLQRLLSDLGAKEAANRRPAAIVEQSGEAILTLDPERATPVGLSARGNPGPSAGGTAAGRPA